MLRGFEHRQMEVVEHFTEMAAGLQAERPVSRSGTWATYEARVRPGLRAAQRRELARLPRSVNRAWARVQQHLAATTAGHLAVVTHGLVCRSLAARHVRVPGGETAPERWENTSVTI